MDTIKSMIHNEYKSNMDKPEYKYCSDKEQDRNGHTIRKETHTLNKTSKCSP